MVKVYDQALAFLRSPEQLVSVRQRELPAELTPLLRLAAGEAEAVAASVAQTGATAETMREAAGLFLQQLLFVPDGDSYRVLGVARDASEERIKEHHRWLVRWLHPDRNPDGWEAVFVNRVNAAWQDLRNPARRGEYDRLGSTRETGSGMQSNHLLRRPQRANEPRPGAGLLPPRVVRALPIVVMGALGTIAALALLLVYARQPVVDQEWAGHEEKLDAEAENTRLAQTKVAAAPLGVQVSTPRIGDPRDDTLPAAEDPVAFIPPAAESAPLTAAAAVPVQLVEANVAPSRLPVLIHPASAQPTAAEPESEAQEPKPEDPVRPIALAGRAEAPIAPAPEPPAREDDTRRVDPIEAPVEHAPRAAQVAAFEAAAEPLRVAEAAAPAVASIAAPPARGLGAAPQGLVDAARAHALVQDFSRAYEAGDVPALRRLFASGSGSGASRERILRDYRKLFKDSARRSMQVSNVSWASRGTSATIFASFDARIVPSLRSKARRIRGDIRFDLRDEGGQLRIVDLRHDGTQG